MAPPPLDIIGLKYISPKSTYFVGPGLSMDLNLTPPSQLKNVSRLRVYWNRKKGKYVKSIQNRLMLKEDE